jgi:hypothetical protein
MNHEQLGTWLTACELVRRHGNLAVEQAISFGPETLRAVNRLLIADALERESLWRFERTRGMAA